MCVVVCCLWFGVCGVLLALCRLPIVTTNVMNDVCCLLSSGSFGVVRCVLFVVCVVWNLLVFVFCCLMRSACCLVRAVCNLLFVVSYMFCVRCCLLRVVNCMLYAV